ncbi:hypothetical protein SLEP1_g47917 [Rubroshorea leprosula]|uniref:Uncharacterized protein n=1 Tax=Rubroshorea leprosula TaxID=152421 RepID=A0AAV5LS49_9ROSI|nr:hypothetical protein SLEP1_g47917 [Rubroshorea leprosula]
MSMSRALYLICTMHFVRGHAAGHLQWNGKGETLFCFTGGVV